MDARSFLPHFPDTFLCFSLLFLDVFVREFKGRFCIDGLMVPGFSPLLHYDIFVWSNCRSKLTRRILA